MLAEQPTKKSFFFYNHYYPLIVIAYLLCFAVTRTPYFLNYDIPGLRTIHHYYSAKILYLLENKLPLFTDLPAFYPMFLYMCDLLGIQINVILIIQAIVSLICVLLCQFYINKYFPRYSLLFFVAALIFYTSALCLNYDTRIEERSLFVNVTLVASVFAAVSFSTGRIHYFVITSILCGLMFYLRHQGLYIIPVVGILLLVLIVERRTSQLAGLVFPILLLFAASSIYNKISTGSFFLGDRAIITAISPAVFFLDESGEYPEEVKAIIRKVVESYSEEEKAILRESWSFKQLRKVITVDYYDDKGGEFIPLFDTHVKDLKRLAFNSKKEHLLIYIKYIYTNFIYCFLINYDDYFFYYNELVNRKYYIESSSYYHHPELSESDYNVIYKEYADYVLKKDALPKSGIIKGENYVDGFSSENFWVKLNHYYQIIHARIFSNLIWLVYFVLASAVSLALILKSRLKEPEILLLQISFIFVICNFIVVSVSIPPLYSYVYPTKFFVYFYPLSISYYLLYRLLHSKSMKGC